MQIAKHKVVAIDFKLLDSEGKLLDSSEHGGPLAYIHGVGSMVPGLEQALEGKQPGDQLHVVLAPKDGYGERDESLVEVLPRSQFEGVEDLAVGMQFEVELDDDRTELATVTNVADGLVTVDFQHPLAGQTLHFDVTVLSVREATETELEHGHVHGPGGHNH